MFRKTVLIFLVFFSFSMSFFMSFAIELSEVQFGALEYIELIGELSNVNGSHFKIIDSSGNNTFELLKYQNNSNMSLIVGQNFIDTYSESELDNLNCSIYLTSGSQVGHGGMSKFSEDFEIILDRNQSLVFEKNENYNFEEFESLHFQYDQNEDEFEYRIIANESICKISIFNISVDAPNTSLQNISTCSLEIIVDEIIESDKISFRFEGNISQGVTYSVFDGLGTEVRSPFSSTTTTSKSYTPKKNGKFVVYAEIKTNTCNIEKEEEIFFYNQDLDVDNEDSSTTINVNTKSEIIIYKTLLRGVDQVDIYFTASRGESSKYRLKIFVNGEEELFFDLKKYSEGDFIIPLKLSSGKHTIEIEGFGKKDTVEIEMPDVVSEIREELIVLVQEKGINVEFNEEIVEKELEVISNTFENKNQEALEVEEIIDVENNETRIGIQKEGYFSKHFFKQNIGVLLIIGGIVFVSVVIIALR